MTRPVARPADRPLTRRTDSGAATAAAVACLGLLLLVGLALGEVGAWFAAHRQARAAADLAALVSQGWLVPDALVVVERSRRSPEPAFPAGFVEVRSRKYGETTLWSAHAPVDEPGETAAEPVAPAPGAGEQ